jgi:hypothetical protein
MTAPRGSGFQHFLDDVSRDLDQAANANGPHLFASDQIVNHPGVHFEDLGNFGNVEHRLAIPPLR